MELAWLFQDAVESASLKSTSQNAAFTGWRSSSDLQQFQDHQFQVRISLPDVIGLWRRRVQVDTHAF